MPFHSQYLIILFVQKGNVLIREDRGELVVFSASLVLGV